MKFVNVGKGMIYIFFKNKEELFDEIVIWMIWEMIDVVEIVIDSNCFFFENV